VFRNKNNSYHSASSTSTSSLGVHSLAWLLPPPIFSLPPKACLGVHSLAMPSSPHLLAHECGRSSSTSSDTAISDIAISDTAIVDPVVTALAEPQQMRGLHRSRILLAGIYQSFMFPVIKQVTAPSTVSQPAATLHYPLTEAAQYGSQWPATTVPR
jgi:hypothetical protein